MIEEGKKLPKFTLEDQNGKKMKLADLTGKKGMVLYAYPKDNTFGCTLEAQAFRDTIAGFKKKGFSVVGISKDSVRSHFMFMHKYDLNFPLLSDPDLELLEPIGAFGEKKMSGKTVKGIIRSTFIVDSKGKILKVYPTVRARGHAEQVLEDLKGL